MAEVRKSPVRFTIIVTGTISIEHEPSENVFAAAIRYRNHFHAPSFEFLERVWFDAVDARMEVRQEALPIVESKSNRQVDSQDSRDSLNRAVLPGEECRLCEGDGSVVEGDRMTPCPACSGTGVFRRRI